MDIPIPRVRCLDGDATIGVSIDGENTMASGLDASTLRPKRMVNRFVQRLKLDQNWYFVHDVCTLIWEYKAFGLTIIVVTIGQELAALWPVNLLGQFVDRLQTGEIGNLVWLFLGASVLYLAIVRGNVMLRHKMFYETDFEKRVELTLKVSDRGDDCSDAEKAGATYTRVENAVSGITNAAYHVLGSFTPVVIKIFVVSGSLLSYNRLLGLTYLCSLSIPILMTVTFNKMLRVLRDAQYSVVSEVSGAGLRVVSERRNQSARQRFVDIMKERRGILINLVFKHQFSLYAREVALVGSQFLVVFLALGLRERQNLTPGDFTRIIGYTTQVAAAFIGSASTLDAIISYSRAYHVYAQAHGN